MGNRSDHDEHKSVAATFLRILGTPARMLRERQQANKEAELRAERERIAAEGRAAGEAKRAAEEQARKLKAEAERQKKEEEEKRRRYDEDMKAGRIPPVFTTAAGKNMYKPIWVEGSFRLIDRKKVEHAGDHRMALMYGKEMLEKGYEQVKLFATAQDGRTYQWAAVGSTQSFIDLPGYE